mgnify:CR=1 FL=1
MARYVLAPMIVADEDIMNGRPTIEGTRITVELILDDLAAGDSVCDIAREYRLSERQVLAAIDFARSLVEKTVHPALEHAR